MRIDGRQCPGVQTVARDGCQLARKSRLTVWCGTTEVYRWHAFVMFTGGVGTAVIGVPRSQGRMPIGVLSLLARRQRLAR